MRASLGRSADGAFTGGQAHHIGFARIVNEAGTGQLEQPRRSHEPGAAVAEAVQICGDLRRRVVWNSSGSSRSRYREGWTLSRATIGTGQATFNWMSYPSRMSMEFEPFVRKFGLDNRLPGAK